MKKGQKADFLCPTGSKGSKEERRRQKWNGCSLDFYIGASPLRHLHSEDTTFVQGKCSQNLCTCYLYWRDTSIWGKGHFLWVSKPPFNLPSGNTLVLKKRLTTKRVDKFHSSLVKMASEFYRMSYLTKIDVLNLWEFNAQHHRFNYGIIFLHFLAAWSNDWGTFWGTIKEKCIICWFNIYKLQLNLHSGDTCLGRAGVPIIKDV